MKRRSVIGVWGEQIAIDFLIRRGYAILGKNIRYKIGEIDIVAKHGAHISFIEVKTRTSDKWSAEYAMNKRKILCLYRSARMFCLDKSIDINYTGITFEQISVYVQKSTHLVTIKKYFLPIQYGHI